MRKMMRKNLVSRVAAAVSSGISCELILPNAWLVVLPSLESIWMASACAESYVSGLYPVAMSLDEK